MLRQIQKEDNKNKLLPYSKVIEEESHKYFQEIKTNLGLCIMYREMRIPLTFWLSRLNRYLDLYNLKFTKEDHVLLVKILYELMTIPNLPYIMIQPLCGTLRRLLGNGKFLIPGEDLTLPWRPLYNLYEKIFKSGYAKVLLLRMPRNVRVNLEALMSVVQFYFDPSVTQEILDELRPRLCPSDSSSMNYAIQMLCLFLPVRSSPELADTTYKLWLHELMGLWEAFSNNSSYWDVYMTHKLNYLAFLNIGLIDWEEYIPTMYSRFLRIFKLPVYYKKVGHTKLTHRNEDRVAGWIVATLGGGSRSQDYLDQLLKTLESYCQSANTGVWTQIIKYFLGRLCKLFVARIRKERFRKPLWKINVPEHKKLNDDDVYRFVISVQSVAMTAIFSPVAFTELGSIFPELATLRPDLVVPPLLDRFYATIDCLTGPHRLTALLQCICGIARPMLTGGLNCNYEEGKKHVIPLMFALLPGIDPNNLQKSIMTIHLITTFLNMVPLVDCSSFSQYSDLTAIEEEVASATSQFEEFILQYMDRIFTFIESLAKENVRIENNNHGDGYLKGENNDMLLTYETVFGQVSPAIFTVALKKMYNYVMFKIFEREVAGQTIATMLRAFSAVNAEETYKLFIPKLCSFILDAVKSQEVKDEDHLDSELLFKMLLLSKIVYGDAAALKPYLPLLTHVLDETLHLKCNEGHEWSTQLLRNILKLLSHVHPLNLYPRESNDANRTFLVREWGRGVTWKEMDIRWYCPGEEEIKLVEQMFWKYLVPELEKVDKYINDEVEYSRDEIRYMLKIIASLFSCNVLLQHCEDEPSLSICESKVPFSSMKLYHGVDRHIRMPDGSNVYNVLINKMTIFQSKLLKKTDDTRSFELLIRVWSYLLYCDKPFHMDYLFKKQILKQWKGAYMNKASSTGSNMQPVRTKEVHLKHLQRILYNESFVTKTDEVAMMCLFELATSEYNSIQFSARSILQAVITDFADNSFLIKAIVENLKLDSTQDKEKFKSTLAMLKKIVNNKWFKSFTYNYAHLKEILPAIVTSIPSEELVVVKLLDKLTEWLSFSNWHFAIRVQIPDNVLDVTRKLWTESEFELLQPMPSDTDIEAGLAALQNDNKRIAQDYEDVIRALMDAIHNKNLQWRYELMAVNYLAVLLRSEEKCSPEVVRYFLKLLIHDSLVFRKVAVKMVVYILKSYKPKTQKEKVDPFAICGTDSMMDVDGELVPGPRPDNAWCRFNKKYVPKNEEEWNEARYSYHCYLGFYCWPREVRLISSPAVQAVNNINFDKLDDVGKEIDSFFSDASNVEKLIEYYCLEEFRGQTLRSFHLYLFKYVFKVHGDRYLEIFKPHFEKVLTRTETSFQLCAAEMLGGFLMGIKLWPYANAQRFIEWCVPLMRKILDNMTVETQKHWGSAIANAICNFDMQKGSFLLDLLMEEPIKGDAAFKDCGRLYVLQGGGFHSWRVTELLCRLLEYVKPHLANHYQNLRERLGHVLVNVFEADFGSNRWNRSLSPQVSDFIDYLLPKLEILYKIAPNSHDMESNHVRSIGANGIGDMPSENEQEAIQLLKTVCHWCASTHKRCSYPLKPDFFKLFPLMCFMENYDKDDELKKCCKQSLSSMSFSIVLQNDIPVFLDAFDKVCNSNSWCAKCTGLEFLQVFAFHNLFLILSQPAWISRILENVLRLLVNNRCEVRQKAGEVISGFFHYHMIEDEAALIEKFKKFSAVSLKEKSDLYIRHAGVIGLCSFINAYPYTVPPKVPPLFADIGEHLKDPEPISGTIRKTLSNFKRTHYSDWDQSKLKFTAEQLEVFSDIMVPPNHYA